MSSNAKCLNCNFQMTWDAQKRQYGRIKKKGLTDEQIKTALPRCQKCMTIYLEQFHDPE